MYKIVAGFHTGFVFGRRKNQSCKAHCSWGCPPLPPKACYMKLYSMAIN